MKLTVNEPQTEHKDEAAGAFSFQLLQLLPCLLEPVYHVTAESCDLRLRGLGVPVVPYGTDGAPESAAEQKVTGSIPDRGRDGGESLEMM